MDKIKMLERLVSIKSNAQERASQESKGNPVLQQEMRAFFLQNGIEQLIMEIQNTIFTECQTVRTTAVYKMHISSHAS